MIMKNIDKFYFLRLIFLLFQKKYNFILFIFYWFEIMIMSKIILSFVIYNISF